MSYDPNLMICWDSREKKFVPYPPQAEKEPGSAKPEKAEKPDCRRRPD